MRPQLMANPDELDENPRTGAVRRPGEPAEARPRSNPPARVTKKKSEIAPVEVLPFGRPGTWEVFAGLSDRAHFCLCQVEAHDAVTDRYFAGMEAEPWHRRRNMAPLHVPVALHFFSDAAIVASAMAVEMFLNYYGVVRLGESFYNANYERLSPTRKVAALLATCCKRHVTKDDPIIQVTRRLFDRRNALVHPKSRDLTDAAQGSGPPHVSPQQLAHESVRDMELFAALFRDFDPDAMDLGWL